MMEVMDVGGSGMNGVPSDPSNLLNGESCSLDLTDQLYLEDLCASTSTFYATLAPRTNLEKLRLSLSYETPNNGETSQDFYTRSVQRLKELAPNLQSLTFDGGYVYKAEEENTQAVESELQRLRSHLDMLSSLFLSHNLPLLRLHFSAIFTFNESTIRAANVPKLLKDSFDFCDHIDDRILQRGLIDFIYITNGLPFTIRLLINVSILRDFVLQERSRFCDGASDGINKFFKFKSN